MVFLFGALSICAANRPPAATFIEKRREPAKVSPANTPFLAKNEGFCIRQTKRTCCRHPCAKRISIRGEAGFLRRAHKLHTPCMDLNVPTRMDGAFCFDCKRREHTQTGGTERFSVKFAAAPPCLWWAEWRIDCSFLQNNQRSVAAHSTPKEKIQIPVERCVVQRTFVCEAWAAYKGIFLKWEGIIEKSTNRFPVKVNDIVRFP